MAPRNEPRSVSPATSTRNVSSKKDIRSVQAASNAGPDTPVPTLLELKNALPKHCFQSSLAESCKYAVLDLVYAAGLFLTMRALSDYRFLFPIYWLAQGTIFWAIFVVGHDCGHGSFSKHRNVNDIIGTIMHSLILTPYTAWKLTHRHHHKNTGNIDKDEIFHPVRDDAGGSMYLAQHGYFAFGMGWFYYLICGHWPRPVNHFSTEEPLFRRHRVGMLFSLATWGAMASFLAYYAITVSGVDVFSYYVMPLFVFGSWLVITTFLHHNDHDVPWYGNSKWDYVRGNLSTIDRSYWPLDHIVHNIGTHQVHHLFPIIPHYKLLEATKAFRARFPEHVRISPEPILPAFLRIFGVYAKQHVVPTDAEFVMYKEE